MLINKSNTVTFTHMEVATEHHYPLGKTVMFTTIKFTTYSFTTQISDIH